MSRMSDVLERLEAFAVKSGMSIEDAITVLEGKVAPTAATVEKVVVADAVTIEQKVVAIGYPLLMEDALALLTGALTGAPWAALMGTLIDTAEAQGHTLAATAADAALSLAKAQLLVAGTVEPLAPEAPTPTTEPAA